MKKCFCPRLKQSTHKTNEPTIQTNSWRYCFRLPPHFPAITTQRPREKWAFQWTWLCHWRTKLQNSKIRGKVISSTLGMLFEIPLMDIPRGRWLWGSAMAESWNTGTNVLKPKWDTRQTPLVWGRWQALVLKWELFLLLHKQNHLHMREGIRKVKSLVLNGLYFLWEVGDDMVHWEQRVIGLMDWIFHIQRAMTQWFKV